MMYEIWRGWKMDSTCLDRCIRGFEMLESAALDVESCLG